MKPPRFLVALVVFLFCVSALLAWGAWHERSLRISENEQRRVVRNEQSVRLCAGINRLADALQDVVVTFRGMDPRLAQARAYVEAARCDPADFRVP